MQNTTLKYEKCLKELRDIQKYVSNNLPAFESLKKIIDDADNSNEKAVFLMDCIQNYDRKNPKWSELTVRMCTVWRFCSPKGYVFCRKNLTSLPSKATILRYLGTFNGQNQLIEQRLRAEILQMKHPAQRICSLIIDDMAIKEKMSYSRTEDHIYGLDTCTSSSVGQNPIIANKMLCFVAQGLSSRFTIPAGYFFHASLTTDVFYSLTMKVLKLLTDCGFIVLRIVTDNFSSNTALFKMLSEGSSIRNQIEHPFLSPLPLFLSFDFCHALKNARNLFLDRDMCSSHGIISSSYLKELYNLQKDLPIKPVRYLTRKHLHPTSLEKMNVLRAIQVFSPAVTASLKFLKEAADESFIDIDATVLYMENMYHFFQVHNVSNRYQCIRTLNSDIAPYVHVSDERLHWLNVTFPSYIDEIQNYSANSGMQGLTNETAHALKFTAQSTYLCITFLLQQAGFYYVLSRSFSSDAVEATFSHVRLKCGSNDTTDARSAEYALRQILRCGVVKASSSSNIAESFSSVSSAPLESSLLVTPNNKEELLLPMDVRIHIQNLQKNDVPDASIYSASVAFVAGYIIRKVEQKFQCADCISPLLTKTVPGHLLRLISLQDRGGLIYPSGVFVGLVKRISDVIQELLPFLKYNKTCSQLTELIDSSLKRNPLLSCSPHKTELCTTIIQTVAKPVIDNICLEQTDSVKRKIICNKPLSRKVLKL